MNIDDLIFTGESDRQTTSSTGKPTSLAIDGVIFEFAHEIVDDRGRLFEVYSGPSTFWSEPIVFSHMFSIRPGQSKGWGVHLEKTDRYCLISGEVLTVLFDSRRTSPTCGEIMEVVLSPSTSRRLLIPPGVWHLSKNLGTEEAFLVDFPTQAYNHAQPDKMRLPIGTPKIPYPG